LEKRLSGVAELRYIMLYGKSQFKILYRFRAGLSNCEQAVKRRWRDYLNHRFDILSGVGICKIRIYII